MASALDRFAAACEPLGFAPAVTRYPQGTGFSIGGTPPFGHRARISTAIDRDLLQYDTVWAAGGTPESCFPLTPAQLVEFSRGSVGDFAARSTTRRGRTVPAETE
ncbi:MAG: hypothetical protein HKN26_11200 [Acidimicrobiales bacterium]|nr:hypothetical protein [Acidimicrobiales bacterium]